MGTNINTTRCSSSVIRPTVSQFHVCGMTKSYEEFLLILCDGPWTS